MTAREQNNLGLSFHRNIISPMQVEQIARTMLAAGIGFVKIDQEPAKSECKTLDQTPKARFIQYWQNNFLVTQLKPGDQIQSRQTGHRTIVSCKPHPKGGMLIKSVPNFLFRNACSNPKGKTLKAHIMGTCDRWDGVTTIEAPSK